MNTDKPETRQRNSRTLLACVAASTFLGLQVGCAALKTPDFLAFNPKPETPVADLSDSQLELKLALAKAAESRGDFKGALSAYEDIVRMNRASADVHHRLALIHDRNGNSLKAEQHYLEGLKQNPENAKVSCDYGYSLYLRESWEDSEAQYQKAIQADPQYLRARVNYGMLLARTGRVDQALEQFALGGLTEGAAHHNVALAAAENGDAKIAKAALEMSQRADQGRSSSGNHHALGQVVERIAARQ